MLILLRSLNAFFNLNLDSSDQSYYLYSIKSADDDDLISASESGTLGYDTINDYFNAGNELNLYYTYNFSVTSSTATYELEMSALYINQEFLTEIQMHAN